MAVAKSWDVGAGSPARFIPSWRLAISLVGCVACIFLYAMRINMSMAIVCMVKTPTANSTGQDNSSVLTTTAPDPDCQPSLGQKSQSNGEFVWDRQVQGFILSSFFWGYIFTQIPGGWLAGKYGGKRVIVGGYLILTLCTMLSPVAARASPWLLVTMRIIEGLASGVFFPAVYALFSHWATPTERARLLTIVFVGNNLGTVITFSISGFLCQLGWPWVFYVFGLGSTIVYILWFTVVFETPGGHPWISETEANHITSQTDNIDHDRPPTPWRGLLTSVPVWGCVLCQLCQSWVGYTMLTSLPLYMKDVLKFDIKANGLYNALPFLCTWAASLVSSWIADKMLESGIFGFAVTRKIMETCSFIPNFIVVIAVSYLTCSQRLLAVALLCVGVGMQGFSRSGMLCSVIDIAPRYSAEITGLSNSVSTLSGIVSPIITGALTPNGTIEEWRKVFFICAGACVFGLGVFVALARGEVQEWAKGSGGQKKAQTELAVVGSKGDLTCFPVSRQQLFNREKKTSNSEATKKIH